MNGTEPYEHNGDTSSYTIRQSGPVRDPSLPYPPTPDPQANYPQATPTPYPQATPTPYPQATPTPYPQATPTPQYPAQQYAAPQYPVQQYTPPQYQQPAPVVFVQPQIIPMAPLIITTQLAPEPPSSGWAIASFICSLLGISLLGVIFGHIALSEINKSGGQMTGRGLAIAGLILGYIPLAIIAFFVLVGVLGALSSLH